MAIVSLVILTALGSMAFAVLTPPKPRPAPSSLHRSAARPRLIVAVPG